MHDPFAAAVARAYGALAAGDAFTASNIAEELLSDALAQWRSTPGSEAACRYVAATTCCASALLAMERAREAYAALMTALAYTARTGVDPSGRLALCVLAWRIVSGLLGSTAPAGGDAARSAVGALTTSLGTLMYEAYYEAGSANPDDPALPEAYASLRTIAGLCSIDTPVADRLPYISTLLETSERLGLLQ